MPRSKRLKYPIRTQLRARIPKRSTPIECTRIGRATTAAARGANPPSKFQPKFRKSNLVPSEMAGAGFPDWEPPITGSLWSLEPLLFANGPRLSQTELTVGTCDHARIRPVSYQLTCSPASRLIKRDE